MTTRRIIGGELSAGGYAVLRDAYRRQAFPSAYRDPGSLERAFTQALALDLSDDLRLRVQDLSLEYRGAWHGFTDKLVERMRALDRDRGKSEDAENPMAHFERWPQFHQESEADRFERRNLNQRMRQAMKDLLGDRAAGLPLG